MRYLIYFAMACLLLAPVFAQEVDVAVYVLTLGKFDVATGSFTADFYLSLKCSENCSQESFEFMNGRASSVDKIIDNSEEKFYRIQANLNSPVDLKKFPFDKQKMQIIIEDRKTPISGLKYAANDGESGIDDSIIFTGWNIDGWQSEVKEHNYGIYNETYSQYIFTTDISRIRLNAFFKTFLPVFFIVLVVIFSFILDPDKITTRLGMAGSALVATVMFHISITNQIPPVGYLTTADKFMVLTYLFLVIAFIINIVLLELSEQKKTELVEKIHRKTEYSVFIFAAVIYILFFLYAIFL